MNTRLLITLLAIGVLAPLAAFGQGSVGGRCGIPACHSDETLRDDGYCEFDSGFPTYGHSHRANDCSAAMPLNRATGMCEPAGGCGSGGGGVCPEHPACPAGQSYRDGGCYNSCAPLAPCDHTIAACESGWTLDTTRGVCRNCSSLTHLVPGGSHLILRPDLIFRSVPVITTAAAFPVARPASTVPYGQHYSICYTVSNIGSAASGAFRVGGAALGGLVSPYQDFAGLGAGATTTGCIAYATTPPPGHYTVELKVDWLNAVTELREDNNTANVPVAVVK